MIRLRNLLCLTALAILTLPGAAQDKPMARVANVVVIDTTMGSIRCRLFSKEAPKAVANFVGLADGSKDWKDPATGEIRHGVPLYSGTIFHRVIPNFMIQGGDPRGTGTGDAGYKFADEIVPSLTFDRPGRLAMANSGPNTNGSQFFITERATPWLNGHYTIFGQCDEASMLAVQKIAHTPRDGHDKPRTDVRINRIVIEPPAAQAAPAPNPSASK